jgi:hypothetical protein
MSDEKVKQAMKDSMAAIGTGNFQEVLRQNLSDALGGPVVFAHEVPTCTKCNSVLTEEDMDWGRKGQPDTLGFYVNCDTCKKPQRLCVYCWNDTDDCNECEAKNDDFAEEAR